MIWNALKGAGGDIWEELLYLIMFNVIWLIGSLFLLPIPLLTFGLVYIAHDIGQGKGIKFSTFFEHARRMWKQAYIWGGINLGLAIIVWLNLNFYAGFGTQWATTAQIVIIAITIFWSILQLLALPLYPHLKKPGFKLALRNASVVLGRYPGPVFMLLVIVAIIGVISSLFPPLAFLGALSMTAVVANRMVGAIVDREMERAG
jgi:uncharacterized membrane protein YesL